MPKNIVILFDGTSNEISRDRTNILRLFGVLKRDDEQIVYYDPGVGTFGAADSWSNAYRKTIEIWGLATGWGIDQNVKEAYRFIVENYQRGAADAEGHFPDHDRLYIFGFSRGAYTARVLAGFIHALGLMSPYHLNLVDYAYSAYKGIPKSDVHRGGADHEAKLHTAPSAFEAMRLYEKTLQTFRPAIKLLGLFDTVSSVIEAGKWAPQLETLPFTNKNPSVEIIRHALAIDERRTMFNPLPWTPEQPYWGGPFRPSKPAPLQDLKQVWFAGVHGDVGGGYPEEQSRQIKIPLVWMIRETTPTGLAYQNAAVDQVVLGLDLTKPYVRPGIDTPLHDSMNWAWRLLEYVPRRVPVTSWRRRGNTTGIYLPLADRRLIPDGALIHQSVLDRMAADGSYAPPNLPVAHAVET